MEHATAIDSESDYDENWNAPVRFDSNKPCWELEDSELSSEGEDSENEDDKVDVEDEVLEAGDLEWRNEGLHVSLMLIAIDNGDDPRDEDWIPHQLRRKYKTRIAKGKSNSDSKLKPLTSSPQLAQRSIKRDQMSGASLREPVIDTRHY